MSIQFATNLFDNLDALPPLVLYAFPRPKPRRRVVSPDWSIKAGDILPYLAIIPGFMGHGAASRALTEIKRDVVNELRSRDVPRNKSYDVIKTWFEEQEDLVAEICRSITYDHPYMDYFEGSWALRAIMWSVMWHGRFMRSSSRIADMAQRQIRVRANSLEV
ncbi:unnamed protein product [Peniophora sp. CBMAI 1063]|nr:unnamed protein product [Peniophora sp. CBMAI 1063]